jgi:DnaJ-class molecular chaperone
MTNFYDILGVSKNATEPEIKKAYRGLSLKNHPDRNNGSEESKRKFQQIGEAYDTLSDPAKKEEYDNELNGVHNPFGGMHGMHGMPRGFPHAFGHTNSMNGGDDLNEINNIFSALFGGGMGGPMGGFPGGGFPGGASNIHVFHNGMPMFQNMQKPVPIVKNVHMKMSDAYSGLLFPLEIERQAGTANNIEKETIYVNIPPGIDENEMIILRDKGHYINDDIRGDVKLSIHIENNTPFIRTGLDLLYKKTISLKESLCGFSFEVAHLNGKTLFMNNMSGRTIIKPKYRKIIPNMGMIKEQNTGNLIIEFDVEFPESLTDSQVDILAGLL